MQGSNRTIIALIPARGGSVGVPGKNIKPIHGKPLIAFTIESALQSSVFQQVWVSTDSEEIARVAEQSGAYVHWRSAESATSYARSEAAIDDFLTKHSGFNAIALIQATSPLTQAKDFRTAWEAFDKGSYDSLVTVTRSYRFRWEKQEGFGIPLNYAPSYRPRRQDWDGELHENGAFYFTTLEQYHKSKCRLGGAILLHEMGEQSMYEIDTAVDFTVVSALLGKD